MCTLLHMAKTHGVPPGTPVTPESARHVARVMGALATASRVRILGRLREGQCSVADLTAAVDMEQPAVSHQLRVLRDLGLVVSQRHGRQVIYDLHDSHVTGLLDEALRHIEHLGHGGSAPVPQQQPPTTPNEERP
jgi:DNA-binding transcriptional ArsR family regulator